MHFLSIPQIWAAILADGILAAGWVGVRATLPSVRYRQWLDVSAALLTLWAIFFWLGVPMPHVNNFTAWGSASAYVELGLLVGLGGSFIVISAKRWLEPTIAQAIRIVWWRFGVSLILVAFAAWLSVAVFGGMLILSAALILAALVLTVHSIPRVYSSGITAAAFLAADLSGLIILASWGAIPHTATIWGPILWAGRWTDLLLAAALGFCLPGLVAWWLGQE